jgi:hypothetical protein
VEERGEEEDQEPSEEDDAVAATGAPPSLRPNDDIDAAARPARPRPTGTDPPPHQASSLASKPSVSAAAASPSLFPTAAGDADEPSVANPRDPPPSLSALVPLLVQEPDAPPPSRPAAAVALRRRVVPRARDAGASRTARPRRGPGQPGPAHVRAHPRREAKPCPRLAASLLDHTEPERVQPRHAYATASPCASTPRCGRDVAFVSRPSL